MKHRSIGTALAILSLLAAGSVGCGSKSKSKEALAYGGLDMVVSAARAATAAPAPFSPMSEPLVLADGATITAAGIVMEDIRFITAPGQELRWKNKNGEHWDGEHMGNGNNESGGMSSAEQEGKLEESLDSGNDDANILGDTDHGGAGDPELERGEDADHNDDIDVELEEENAKPKLPGPYYVDLLAGRAYPEFATTAIPAGAYSTILFRLGDVTAENAASLRLETTNPIVGNSLIIEGTFTAGPAVIPFRILFAEDDSKTYRFDFVAGLGITPDTTNTVVLEFNVNQWVINLELLDLYQDGACEAALTCTVDGDGVYNFSIAETELRDSFREHFRNSASCGKDEDDDGELDDDEHEDMNAEMDNEPQP